MEEFSKFLAQYWQLILAAVLTVISTIVAFVRKRPINVINLWDEILAQVVAGVPSLVALAENIGTQDKKAWVLAESVRIAERSLSRGLDEKEALVLYSRVNSAVESVLYCPTKKGGLGREA